MDKKVLIKIKLLEKGLKQSDIARELQVSDSMVNMVISGKRKSKKIEAWIKQNLGVKL